jgi:hypothetical protein
MGAVVRDESLLLERNRFGTACVPGYCAPGVGAGVESLIRRLKRPS